MKKSLLFILVLLCLCLAGCKKTPPLKTENEIPVRVTEGPTLIPTVAPDWSNWVPGMAGGMAANLYMDADQNTVMRDGEAKAEQGTLSVFLGHRWDLSGYQDAGKVNILYLVAVNGEICDFELNGQASEQGMLVVRDMELEQDYMDSFVIRGCSMVEGENTFVVHQVAYFPNIGHTLANGMKRTFLSETTEGQTSEYSLLFEDLEGAEIVTEDIDLQPGAGTTEEREFRAQKISFSAPNCCMTIAADGGLKIEFTNRGHAGSDNYGAVCLMLRNGELVPTWDGHLLLELPMSRKDKVTLPVSIPMVSGEHAQMTFVFLSLEDGDSFCREGLFLFQ